MLQFVIPIAIYNKRGRIFNKSAVAICNRILSQLVISKSIVYCNSFRWKLWPQMVDQFFKSSSKWALSNPPTTDQPNHQTIDSIIIFKRLGNRKIFWYTKHSHSWENYFVLLSIWWIFIFITLNTYKRKRSWINEIYFLGFKLYCCIPPQIFQSYFLHIEISVRPDVFSIYSNSLYED